MHRVVDPSGNMHWNYHTQNAGYLLDIIFMCDSLDAVTPVKYEYDANDLMHTFARSKFSLMGNQILPNGKPNSP